MRDSIADGLGRRIKERGGWVNAHSHLDIAHVIDLGFLDSVARAHQMGSVVQVGELPLETKIELLDVRLRSDRECIETLEQRIGAVLESHVAQGARAIRTCLTFGTEIGGESLDVVERLKERWSDRIVIQVVALHLRAVLDRPEERRLFEEVCAQDAIATIGGFPQVHPDQVDEYFEWLFDLASRLDKPIEAHTDEMLWVGERETEQLAKAALAWRARGYRQPVSAVHAITLSARVRAERQRVAEMLAEGEVGVVVCPRSALSIATLEIESCLHNAIAPVGDLLEAGVVLALGTDNIGDVFLPFSGGHLMEELDILAEATRFYDLDVLAAIGSTNGATVMGL